MSVDFPDAIKQTFAALFDKESLEALVSEQTTDHPMVQSIWPALGGLSWVPVLNIIIAVASWARFGWFYAHAWNGFWWGLLFTLFFNFWWLWILDAWGWVEMDGIYQIFAPLNDNGEYGIVDDWVNVNTWTFQYTIEVIEKDTGVAFDMTNETHMQKLKDFTWPYIFEQLNMINYSSNMFLTHTFWILLCPSMYVDEEGMALDGFPLMLAKSHQLSLMYWGDYSWMNDPYNRKLPLDVTTFIGTFINVIWGYLVYAF